MTVIAWDGVTLAADKQASSNGMIRTVTKIFKLPDGSLFGGSGDFAFILQMYEWLQDGEKFPEAQRDKDDWQPCFVISREGVFVYERAPCPIRYEDFFFASGSGRDFALAALHCGKTAREAVELACKLSYECGNGIDTLTLGD